VVVFTEQAEVQARYARMIDDDFVTRFAADADNGFIDALFGRVFPRNIGQ
jgi:hypothetical protein